jgi:Initiator Rep protein, WH2
MHAGGNKLNEATGRNRGAFQARQCGGLELRRNMDRCVETFSIERFREMLGVKTDTYKLGPDFQRFVIDPAVLEVNGLPDLGVRMQLDRKHSRAPIHAVTMAWWRKSPEGMAAAIRETEPLEGRPYGSAEGGGGDSGSAAGSAGVMEVIASAVS